MNQDEIVERVRQRKKGDIFGFEWAEYVLHLDYEHAKEFMTGTDPKVRDEWKAAPVEREALLVRMKDYMAFAFEKANDRRGISANRSVMHYIAWTWLAGDRDFSKEIEDDFAQRYEFYGKPILRKICARYGWDASEWDDGKLTNGDED